MMRLKKTAIFFAVAGGIFIVWLFVMWLLLPGFLESRILPELALENGIGWRGGRIHRIGLTGFDAGAVVIGRGDETGVSVDAVHVDYTPWGLYKKRIDGIHISGVSLNVSVEESGVAIRGLDMKGAPAPPGPSPAESSTASPVARGVELRNISISHAVLHVSRNGRQWRIPFDLTARLEPADKVDALLSLYPCGEKVQASAEWHLEEARGEVSIVAQSLSLEKVTAMAGAVPGTFVSDLTAEGEVDIQAGALVRLNPFTVEDLAVNLAASTLGLHYKGMGIAAPAAVKNVDKRLHVQLKQSGQDRYKLKCGNLVVLSQVPLVLESVDGDLSLDPDLREISLQAVTRVPAFTQETGLPVLLEKDFILTTDVVGSYAEGSDWHLAVTGLPETGGCTPTPISLVQGNARVAAGPLGYRIRLQGKAAEIKGTCKVSTDGVAVETGSGTVRVGRVSLEGRATADTSDGQLWPTGWADLTISDVDAVAAANAAPPLRVVIPVLRCRADMHAGKGTTPAFKGYLDLAESSLAAPGAGLILSGITARVPWEWPASRAVSKGMISVARMQWQHMDMGSLGMTVGQHDEGLAVRGHHLNNQLPELSLDFSGDLQLTDQEGPRAQVSASWSRPATAAEIDLGRFVEKGAGIHIKGALHGEFTADYTAGRMHASACARMGRTTIRIPEKDLIVDNLDVGVCLPHLPALTTGPSQTLTFEQAKMGNFKIEGGRFHFQLEPHRTLFLEKGRIGWCGGHIRLQPMRITPGIDEYDVRLDCDRLNLAAILEQLAVADARGDGTVNGTIPVSLKKGRIRFNDGFLYSTPGEGGKIHLSGADALMAGIPKGTRQFFQVDLAREALKDFEYNWAKLRLVSEEEALRMRLQFDGKPGRILPFEYDEEFGGFVRVGADSRGSEFQGISLDVNFRVPLNDLLEYRDVLEMFN